MSGKDQTSQARQSGRMICSEQPRCLVRAAAKLASLHALQSAIATEVFEARSHMLGKFQRIKRAKSPVRCVVTDESWPLALAELRLHMRRRAAAC